MAASAQVSFHRRALPPSNIAFSSARGRGMFSEALGGGSMRCFFRLVEQFRTQDEPAYCGLSTLTMVLNALDVDPLRTWKGPWRWFHESMLDCCEPLETVKAQGITFSKLACLARCNGAHVEAHRGTPGGGPGGAATPEEAAAPPSQAELAFRSAVLSVCCDDDDDDDDDDEGGGGEADDAAADSGAVHALLVVSYSRKEFGQTGDGHFSPIGGYHAASDSVLIMDVARFKYPPHWVPLRVMWRALCRVDGVTGQPRGYMLLAPRPSDWQRNAVLRVGLRGGACDGASAPEAAAEGGGGGGGGGSSSSSSGGSTAGGKEKEAAHACQLGDIGARFLACLPQERLLGSPPEDSAILAALTALGARGASGASGAGGSSPVPLVVELRGPSCDSDGPAGPSGSAGGGQSPDGHGCGADGCDINAAYAVLEAKILSALRAVAADDAAAPEGATPLLELLRKSVARGDYVGPELALANLLAVPPPFWGAMVAAAPCGQEGAEEMALAVAARLPPLSTLEQTDLQPEIRMLRNQVGEIIGGAPLGCSAATCCD